MREEKTDKDGMISVGRIPIPKEDDIPEFTSIDDVRENWEDD